MLTPTTLPIQGPLPGALAGPDTEDTLLADTKPQPAPTPRRCSIWFTMSGVPPRPQALPSNGHFESGISDDLT